MLTETLQNPKSSMRIARFLLISCFAVLLFIPLGKGELPGYDDALYAHIAKGAFESGDWLHLSSNGYPALEHPPLLPWLEAALFQVVGKSDAAARFPSAACGFLTILLVGWLARRLIEDDAAALLATFCMGTSLYFLKYAARGMTDVPFAFFFLCAICCWALAKNSPRFLLLAGLFTAAAQMTRGMMGLALPLLFVSDSLLTRRRISMPYALAALVLAFAPPVLWYWHLQSTYGEFFTEVHARFLARDLTTPNPLTPFRFLWMLAKSYWPWFPAMAAGLYFTRSRLLLLWIAAVFAACVVVRNPVLRYLLPAYPAFAIASGAALRRWIPEKRTQPFLLFGAPAIAASMAMIAAFTPPRHDAIDLKAMAAAGSLITTPEERIAFYDEGASRFDESNLLQWYGRRNLYILETHDELATLLKAGRARVMIVDGAEFNAELQRTFELVARSGHFCLIRARS